MIGGEGFPNWEGPTEEAIRIFSGGPGQLQVEKMRSEGPGHRNVKLPKMSSAFVSAKTPKVKACAPVC